MPRILKRHISTISGLEDRLANIVSAGAALSSRLDVIEGDENTQGSVAYSLKAAKDYTDAQIAAIDWTPVQDNAAAIALLKDTDETKAGTIAKMIVDKLYPVRDNLQDQIDSNATDIGDLQTIVDTIDSAIATINGDDQTEGSIKKAIADLIGGNPDALDTLKELTDYINQADSDLQSALETMISTNIQNAKDELRGSVSDAMDTMEEIVAAIDAISKDGGTIDTKVQAAKDELNGRIDNVWNGSLHASSNLSDLADKASARTNLDVYSKGEVDSAIANVDGKVAAIKQRYRVTTQVSGEEITIDHAKYTPGSIVNFGRVAVLDGDITWDVVAVEGSDSDHPEKVLVQGDIENQFDGKAVIIEFEG